MTGGHRLAIVKRDRTGAPHYLLPRALDTAAQRYETTIKAYLSRRLDLDAQTKLAFCLVVFDGILDRANLKSALQALSTRYQTDSHVLVDWFRSKDWLDRRRLSVWTLIALEDRHRTPESEQATENMITDLDRALKEMRDFRGLDGLFRDSHAWLLRVAPGPACSHADGTNVMTPLPRSALARAETKLALPVTPPDHHVDAALGDAISSYFSSSNVASVRHDILDQLLAAARSKDRKKGLSLAISLGRQSRHAAPITALVVAWSIDLMESGTRRTVELSQSAVEKYTRLLVRPLVREFAGKRVEDLDDAVFVETYQHIIARSNESERGATAAALTSWHEFLTDWLDVPPLDRSLHADIPRRPAKANIVLPHERELITTWLASTDRDRPRAHDQAQVAWALLRSARIRIGELFGLLLSSVNLYDEVLIIEISGRKAAPLKTKSAHRTIEIREPDALKTILNWKERRQQRDLALPDDFLFGDPHQPGELCDLGATYTYINRLLKTATGEHSASTHTLSHTWICEEINAAFSALRSEFVPDINPLDVIASAAGHAGPSTTFVNYYHWPDALLRSSIDQGVDELIDWRHVRSAAQLSHDAYRQRLSRSRRLGAKEAASPVGIVRAALPSQNLPRASDGLNLLPAATPELLVAPEKLHFDDVMAILRDMFDGISPSNIASRSGCTSNKIDLVKTCLQTVLTRLDGRRKASASAADLTALKGEIQFNRVDHEKLAFLRRYLLTRASSDEAGRAALSWASCYRNGYVSLIDPSQASGLIKLLCDAEVPMNIAVVNVACLGKSELHETPNDLEFARATLAPEVQKAARGARILFAASNPAPPTFLPQSHRRGRPPVHFQLCGTAADKLRPQSGAALAMSGFNALLLSCAVWSEFNASSPN